jgi:hypothetical protein
MVGRKRPNFRGRAATEGVKANRKDKPGGKITEQEVRKRGRLNGLLPLISRSGRLGSQAGCSPQNAVPVPPACRSAMGELIATKRALRNESLDTESLLRAFQQRAEGHDPFETAG